MIFIISANVEIQSRAIKDLAPWIPKVRKKKMESGKSLKCSKKPDGVIFLGGTGDVWKPEIAESQYVPRSKWFSLDLKEKVISKQ